MLIASRASSVPSCQWLYIITFGGGLVEGDNVCVDVKVGELSTVVVTTQASTKVCYAARAILYQISSKKLSTYFKIPTICLEFLLIEGATYSKGA